MIGTSVSTPAVVARAAGEVVPNSATATVAVCQDAPHKDHRRAECRAQQHRTGEVFRSKIRRDECLEHREEEQKSIHLCSIPVPR